MSPTAGKTPPQKAPAAANPKKMLCKHKQNIVRELSRPEKGTPITLGRSCDPGDESTSVAAGTAGFSKALRVWQAPTGGGR